MRDALARTSRPALLAGVLAACTWARGARAAETPGADLVAAARSGGRPEECGGAARTRAGRWERARYPGLGRYCDALAAGHAVLRAHPEQALAASASAELALPGRAGARVLAARAQAALGNDAEALKEFARARAIAPRSATDPAALRDLALVELRSGHGDAALAAYRELVPRAALLGDPRVELTILVEAAVLAMSRGPDFLPLAVGYATEARRRSAIPGLGDAVLATLALALDRSGRTAEAAGIAAESSGPWWLESEREKAVKGAPTALPALPPGELDAMIALLAEKRDRALALDRWTSYLATPGAESGPFSSHAAAHRASLARARPRTGTP